MNLIEVLKTFERPIEITQSAVDFALERLNEEQKQILILRFVEGNGKLHDNKDRQRIAKIMNSNYSRVRFLEIKGLRKMLDIIPQYYFNKENLIEFLKTHTKDEAIWKYKVTKKYFNEFVKENNIEVPYERRTVITKGLIPVKSPYNKLIGKKRDKYNSQLQINKDKEFKTRNQIKKELENQLGYVLAENSILNNSIRDLMKRIDYQKSLLDCLYKCDAISFIEEESFGNHILETDIKDLLTDDMIITYVSEKYGINKGIALNTMLKGTHDEQI